MINNDTDDENEIVEWINKPLHVTFALFDCGCCDDCICDINISCANCKCSCQVSTDMDDNSDSDEKKKIVEYSINDFTIDIIEDKDKERKVRVNVNIDFGNDYGNLHKNIIIKLDINKSLYLQIAEDLFNL